MDAPRPILKELAGLRQFLSSLEDGSLKLSRHGVDVTQEEIGVLKREIEHLEKVLARTKLGSGDA